MRKLLLSTIVSFCILAPAAALAAAEDGDAAGSPPPGALVSPAPFAVDPFHLVEAREQAREAITRAKRKARPAPTPKVSVSPALEAIAACESGGDPTAVSSSGAYRGKYQFSVATWQAVGGNGDPAAAPEAEQDLRATMLYQQSGPGQWPTCGS